MKHRRNHLGFRRMALDESALVLASIAILSDLLLVALDLAGVGRGNLESGFFGVLHILFVQL